jgi:hypothetical protein
VFPRRIAVRPLPTQHLAALVQRAVPVLRYLEKLIHPRWPTPLNATKRLVGTVVVLLNITLLFTPVPLSNVVPALVIALISLAYLEEDGLLLSIALLASVVVLAVELMAVWETILGAKWIVAFGISSAKRKHHGDRRGMDSKRRGRVYLLLGTSRLNMRCGIRSIATTI